MTPHSGGNSYRSPKNRASKGRAAAERDAAGGGVVCLLGRDQPSQQRSHRRALVGEHPGIAPRAGQGERLSQAIHRGCLLAAGRERQCLQRPDLDDAARLALGGHRRADSVQERKSRARAVLGE
jgi:hypothetical protein